MPDTYTEVLDLIQDTLLVEYESDRHPSFWLLGDAFVAAVQDEEDPLYAPLEQYTVSYEPTTFYDDAFATYRRTPPSGFRGYRLTFTPADCERDTFHVRGLEKHLEQYELQRMGGETWIVSDDDAHDAHRFQPDRALHRS